MQHLLSARKLGSSMLSFVSQGESGEIGLKFSFWSSVSSPVKLKSWSSCSRILCSVVSFGLFPVTLANTYISLPNSISGSWGHF